MSVAFGEMRAAVGGQGSLAPSLPPAQGGSPPPWVGEAAATVDDEFVGPAPATSTIRAAVSRERQSRAPRHGPKLTLTTPTAVNVNHGPPRGGPKMTFTRSPAAAEGPGAVRRAAGSGGSCGRWAADDRR